MKNEREEDILEFRPYPPSSFHFSVFTFIRRLVSKLQSKQQISDLEFKINNTSASTKAQLSQQNKKINELIRRREELQILLCGVREQNEALND